MNRNTNNHRIHGSRLIITAFQKTILRLSVLAFCFTPLITQAKDQVVNVYNWSNYLPDTVIKQFERETGIKVNYSVFDNNETLYTKIKTSPPGTYDVIVPSTYYVARMRKENLLTPLDISKLTHYANLDRRFLNPAYDPGNRYSIPYLWGTTGIIINTQFKPARQITRWADLWRPIFHNQILLLDESRDVFSMVLLTMGASINTTDQMKIHQAYDKLVTLLPNVKLFNSMAIPNILIDEDVNIAMVWSGEAFFAVQENPNLRFIHPREGFAFEMDCLAIPSRATHLDNAYRFIDFILRPDIAQQISLHTGRSSPNQAAQKLMPKAILTNPIINPPPNIIARGVYQLDNPETTLLYTTLWTRLKLHAMQHARALPQVKIRSQR